MHLKQLTLDSTRNFTTDYRPEDTMAGDWIKWVKGLVNRREVIAMSQILSLDPKIIAASLMQVWEWVDSEVDFSLSSKCHAPMMTTKWVDCHVGVTGFAVAMQKVGWLEVTEQGLNFPNAERHNGKTAKRRAQNQKNQQARRGCVINLSSSDDDKTVTREEKRREELGELDSPKTPFTTEAKKSPPVEQASKPGFLQFPVINADGQGESWELPHEQVEAWEQTYTLDVRMEVRKALEWIRANRARRKTARGMARFLVNWLNKAQERGVGRPRTDERSHTFEIED